MKRRYVIYNSGKYESFQHAQADQNCSEIIVNESNPAESDMFDRMCAIIQNECNCEISVVDLGYVDKSTTFGDWQDIGTSE